MKSLVLGVLLAAPVFAQELKIKEVPQEVIEFKRVYSALSWIHSTPITVEIEAKFAKGLNCHENDYSKPCTYEIMRELYGHVYQNKDTTKEAMISYDVRNPADKIIDKDVLFFVRAVSTESLHRDAAYVKQGLTEFKDESGNHWRKF